MNAEVSLPPLVLLSAALAAYLLFRHWRDGAGVGLSLVKWIVDRHEGTIAVQSRVGEGSTFTVRLP